MSVRSPHFLLFSEARRLGNRPDWHFVIAAADGSPQFEAADSEPHTRGERLELLAVVRGLEALDQPSQVTIYTPSRYVHRGLRFGLPEWRSSGWQWERYGQMVPVKDRDLWRRVDRALQFHQVECRTWRLDEAHTTAAAETRSAVPRPHFLSRVTPPTRCEHPVVNDVVRLVQSVRRLGLRGTCLTVRRWATNRAAICRAWISRLQTDVATRFLLGEAAHD
jgi:ribonuclease HI